MTVTRRPIECVLVDLDDCLYHAPGMSHQVATNIRAYMVEKLGVPADEVHELCMDLYLNYGTTLSGLVAKGHSIDYDDWHAQVHGSLDYESYLKADPELRSLLDSMPLPKWIFTNADRTHAERCLGILGVRDCFQGVICFESVMEAAANKGWVRHNRPVVCKPNRQAYQLALEASGSPSAATTLWLDDSTRNIATGHRLGMLSVLVGRTGVDCPADHQIERIHALPSVLPYLWEPLPKQQTLGKADPVLINGPQGEPVTAILNC